ncbi:unnamed protein product [Diamesa hyperborea]
MMSPVNKRNSSMSPRDRDMNSHNNQPTTSTNNNYQQSQIELISFINNEFNKISSEKVEYFKSDPSNLIQQFDFENWAKQRAIAISRNS